MHERNQDNGVIPGRNNLTQDVEQKKMQVLLCVLNVNSLRQYLKEKFNIPCTHSPYFHLNGKCKNVSTSKKKKMYPPAKQGGGGSPHSPRNKIKFWKQIKATANLKNPCPDHFYMPTCLYTKPNLELANTKGVWRRDHIYQTLGIRSKMGNSEGRTFIQMNPIKYKSFLKLGKQKD